MVDNRAAGYYGVGGSFSFKSGDISGTAASLQDDKAGQGSEYMRQEPKGEEKNKYMSDLYVDRSAQLSATLNSLAMLNVASVLNAKKRFKSVDDNIDDLSEEDAEEYFLNSLTKKKPAKDDEFAFNIDEDDEDDEYY